MKSRRTFRSLLCIFASCSVVWLLIILNSGSYWHRKLCWWYPQPGKWYPLVLIFQIAPFLNTRSSVSELRTSCQKRIKWLKKKKIFTLKFKKFITPLPPSSVLPVLNSVGTLQLYQNWIQRSTKCRKWNRFIYIEISILGTLAYIRRFNFKTREK